MLGAVVHTRSTSGKQGGQMNKMIKSLSENPLGHDMAGSALSARRESGANTRSGLGPGEEHRGRVEYAVPAAGGVSFHVGQRYLFGGKTALGIPARTAALPSAKTQAIMVPVGFRIGSKMCAVVLVVALAASVSMAQSRGGGHYGGGHYSGGHYGGGHYGYYHSGSGDLIFGLLGLSIFAAALADQPMYVEQPVPLVYQAPPQMVYVEQPWAVYHPPPPALPPPVMVQPPVQVMASPPSPAAPVVVTVNVTNSNGSYMPVPLRQEGPLWVGPRGEYYNQMPTMDQLRPVYGF